MTSSLARGSTLTEATTKSRPEITAERSDYQTLERIHKDATRARDATTTLWNEEVEGRRSAEEIVAGEKKLAQENEEWLRRDATVRLAEGH